jgi:hypothetical protein
MPTGRFRQGGGVMRFAAYSLTNDGNTRGARTDAAAEAAILGTNQQEGLEALLLKGADYKQWANTTNRRTCSSSQR